MVGEQATSDEVEAIDGRRARRDRNRETVVDALLELYREGEMAPSVARVAERSGVSHRSVFRYFDDLEELLHVAVERQTETLAPLFELPDAGGVPLADRIDQFVDCRMALYEEAAPVARVARMRAPLQPILEENMTRRKHQLREQFRSHFEPEIERHRDADAVLAAASTLGSFEGIEVLRRDCQLSAEDASASLRVALSALLAEPDPTH